MLEERATEAFKKYEQELKRRAKSYCYREQIAGLNWQDYYSEFLITFVKLTQEFEADGPEFERGG
ncbi:hypothetical protein [Levilactobacillus andaensis]|uniref:hypothetical protein n=1 Tax=Levilactobacillus andaensis TaxID=2799570 RepID=UPI0019434EA3|nr:hypothetical protein [Levilactobacillus andaensis]